MVKLWVASDASQNNMNEKRQDDKEQWKWARVTGVLPGREVNLNTDRQEKGTVAIQWPLKPLKRPAIKKTDRHVNPGMKRDTSELTAAICTTCWWWDGIFEVISAEGAKQAILLKLKWKKKVMAMVWQLYRKLNWSWLMENRWSGRGEGEGLLWCLLLWCW